MERVTLREAAARTSRSITTLRRYIRSGRLNAEKRYGRFGPEYFVAVQDLARAGLEPDPTGGDSALTVHESRQRGIVSTAASDRGRERESVPVSLFQDLQMKHEQLLVQYGMIRAGGLRLMALQAELEAARKELDGSRDETNRLREKLRSSSTRLEQQLREAELELKARALEIAALREKVRALEMLTRNAVTTETIEKQFGRVMAQARRVDALVPRRQWRLGPTRPPDEGEPRDH